MSEATLIEYPAMARTVSQIHAKFPSPATTSDPPVTMGDPPLGTEKSSGPIPRETPIILLHGLGSHWLSLWPLEKYLNWCGYTRVYNLSYPVDLYDQLEPSLAHVDEEMLKHVTKEEEVVLVGQSMGGVVSNNLYQKGWRVRRAIYIGSPLHGANFLNQLEERLPTRVRNWFFKPPYELLKNKARDPEPPHDYRTISMGWFHTHFDGCVYREETTLDPKKHTHLSWADHRTIFANPRLWWHVKRLLEEE